MSDAADIDSRLNALEALGNRLGMFRPDPEQLARDAVERDQQLRMWAIDRAIVHVGAAGPERVVSYAAQLAAFVQGDKAAGDAD